LAVTRVTFCSTKEPSNISIFYRFGYLMVSLFVSKLMIYAVDVDKKLIRKWDSERELS